MAKLNTYQVSEKAYNLLREPLGGTFFFRKDDKGFYIKGTAKVVAQLEKQGITFTLLEENT